MDQNTIQDYLEPRPGQPLPDFRPGDAWLGGGTFLFSTPLPQLKRFVDLTTLDWPSLIVDGDGLHIAATCTVEQLHAFRPPEDWVAGPLLRQCVEAFLASFKIWHTQTVGGNICTSLPAGPMITLTCALEATYEVWAADGEKRRIPAIDFVTGDHQNILGPGELLRAIFVSRAALARRFALRRFSLTQAGRSSVFLVGTVDDQTGEFLLTISAATVRPVHVRFAALPDGAALQDALEEQVADALYFFDPNGRPDHRKHLTQVFAEDIRAELAAEPTPFPAKR